MEEAKREEQLAATIREKEGYKLALEVAEAEGNEERAAEIRESIKSCEASIKYLTPKAKAPAKRAEKRPAAESEER